MATKKAKGKGKGTRYSAEEKAEILDFAANYGRGGQTAAAKKFNVSPLTISNWKKSPAAGGKSKGKPQAIEKDVVLRGLAKKGFKIVRMMNALTGEVLEDKIDPKIKSLNLEFGGVPARPNDDTTYVSSTSGPVLVTLTLDRLLALTGTKP